MVGGPTRPGAPPESVCSAHHRALEGQEGETDVDGEEGTVGGK